MPVNKPLIPPPPLPPGTDLPGLLRSIADTELVSSAGLAVAVRTAADEIDRLRAVPVTDELAIAEQVFERWERGYELPTTELMARIEGLYGALRAALAAQPQPVICPECETVIHPNGSVTRVVDAGYQEAAAGSTTLTGDNDE